jgi:hypothetical protein
MPPRSALTVTDQGRARRSRRQRQRGLTKIGMVQKEKAHLEASIAIVRAAALGRRPSAPQLWADARTAPHTAATWDLDGAQRPS